MPHRVGYDSEPSPRAGVYQYHFWDLGACLTLESDYRFLKGDVVMVKSIDVENHRVQLTPVFGDSVADRALMFVAPKVPLSAHSEFDHRTNDCDVLHNRVVRLNGNMTIITLLSAPVFGKSSLTFIEKKSKDRWHYFMDGGDK